MMKLLTYKGTKLVVRRDKHLIFIFNTRLCREVRYNLKLNRMEKYNEKHDIWEGVCTQYDFFSGLRIGDINCEEEKFKNLLYKSAKVNSQCNSVSSYISRLNNVLVYEHFIDMDIKTECEISGRRSYYGRTVGGFLKVPLEGYNKNVIKFFKECDFTVSFSFEEAYGDNKDLVINLIDYMRSSDFSKEEKSNLVEELINNINRFSNLVDRYNFKMESLINYIVGYLIPFENLRMQNALTLLDDYYRMANEIGRNVKKYPKYLKSIHDIITANYNAFKKEYDENRFKEMMKPELCHNGGVFVITIPKETGEIIKEGTSLNHCVSSYVNKVIRGDVYIMFLRKKKSPEESLITLEYQNNKITQAKGSYNRPLEKKEKDYLKIYCREKGIEIKI